MARTLDVGQAGREVWLTFFDAEDNGRLNVWGFGFAQQLIPQYKWTMIDGHMPFAQRGILAVDLVDFDYPDWHTTQVTADKVSPRGLERIGQTISAWLEQTRP